MVGNIGDIIKMRTPGMNTKFMTSVANAQIGSTWDKIADVVPSTQVAETYPFLGNIPTMTKFEGERKRRKFSEYSFVVSNETWESTVAIKRQLLLTDQYGKLNDLASQLGRRFPAFLDRSVYTLLGNGFSTVGYDGSNYFDTTHSDNGSAAQSNKDTTALSGTSFATNRALMMNFKDDQGVPVGIQPNILAVNPAQQTVAIQIVQAVTVTTGGVNVYAGLAEPFATPYITDQNDWFLLDVRVQKPIIVQELSGIQVGFSGDTSEAGSQRMEYEYGAIWDGQFAFADWRVAFGVQVP